MFFNKMPVISDVRLDGKTVIVTGANSGIGYVTAKNLANRGAKVIFACRNVQAGEKAVEEVKKMTSNDKIYMLQLDLASLESVRTFVKCFIKKENELHILVNNAGVMALPERQLSVDGYEMQFAVNHLGHFLLTKLLIDMLKSSAPSRIVNVSSAGHVLATKPFDFDNMNLDRGYGAWTAYGRSKLSNILFTNELHKKYSHYDVSSFSLHPGLIATNLARHTIFNSWLGNKIMQWTWLSQEQGAETSIFCAVQPDIESLSGEYFEKRMTREPSGMARDPILAEQLWEVSEKMTSQDV